MYNETTATQPSSGSVAFSLMIAQAAVPAELVLPKAVMLVATQLLLDRLAEGSADRLSIICGQPSLHEGADAYQAVLGRGRRPIQLLVPSIHRFYKTSVLSILKVTSAATCRVLMNGMPGKGCAEVLRWGDSGACELRWPRSLVEKFLASPRFDTMTEEAKRDTTRSYGDTPALVVEGETLVLPPIAQCEKVWRALHGETVVVTSAELDLIEPAMCAGLRLVSAPNPARIGILDAFVLQLPPAQPH